jgi:hypothetical protein
MVKLPVTNASFHALGTKVAGHAPLRLLQETPRAAETRRRRI